MRTRWLLAAAMALTAAQAQAAAGGARMLLYVDNSLGDDLTVVDLGTMKVAGRIVVGKEPHGLCAPADGRSVFVTVESEHSLKQIDTATGKIVKTVALSGRPNECAVTPDGHYVGVPIRDGNSVEIVDARQGRVVKTLPVKVPHNCYNTGSNTEIWVSSMGGHEIDRIDLTTMTYTARVPVGGIPRPYAVSADGRTVYSALTGLHGFVMADVTEQKVTGKVELPAAPPLDCPLEVNTPTHGIALRPDGRELWATSLADGGVYRYELETKTTSKMIRVGKCPNWIVFSPDGKYGVVSNSEDDDCSILDAMTGREAARVKTGRAPKRVLVVKAPAA